jgi:hypothetical protein
MGKEHASLVSFQKSNSSRTAFDPRTAYAQQTRGNSQQARFSSPKTFRSAIDQRLDHAFVSLFRLGARISQFVFALATGICYAVELGHGSISSHGNTNYIYAEVVFGLSLITLIIEAWTIRQYRLTWIIEWTLCLLWFVVFAVFYMAYYAMPIEPQYTKADITRMKNLVWVDLVNALLWMSSALFSTTMCCSGLRAKVRGKTEEWRIRRQKKNTISAMEQGTLQQHGRQEEPLPA